LANKSAEPRLGPRNCFLRAAPNRKQKDLSQNRTFAHIRDVELPRVLTSTGQRSFSFHGPTVCGTGCRLLCARRQSFTEDVRAAADCWRLVFGSNCTPPGAPLWRFVIMAPSINAMTYLLNYLSGMIWTNFEFKKSKVEVTRSGWLSVSVCHWSL